MLSTHPGATEVERRLDEISGPYGGCADGWGTFGIDDPPKGEPKPDPEGKSKPQSKRKLMAKKKKKTKAKKS